MVENDLLSESVMVKKENSICLFGLENLSVLAPEYKHLRVGGEHVQQTLLARALAGRGYQVSMIVWDYGQPDGKIWGGITTYKACRHEAGLPGLRFFYPRWAGMWSALKRANADVYYTSCAGMQAGLIALFCKKYHRRFVYRCASDADCDPSKLLVGLWRDKHLYRYGLTNAAAVIAQSQWQKNALLSNYGAQSVVADMFVESPGPIVPNDKRDIDLLWVNNIYQLKRPELFLALVRELRGVTAFMIGGAGNNGIEKYNEIKAESSNIVGLNLLGPIPYHDIGTYYSRAKILVNTSKIEGFPNSYLQAWIRGVPVVSYIDPDGIIANNCLGSIVSSIDEMRDEVIGYINNPQKYNKISKNCINFIRDNFNEDDIISSYLSVFT